MMDYEKKYNDALERARNLYDGVHKGCKEVIDNIFPELTESEDERIRNLIYCLIRDRSDNQKLLEHNGVSVDKALAYLEKQKKFGPVYTESCGLPKTPPSFKLEIPIIEKQKELFESGRGLYYYDGEKTIYCGYPATEENPYDFAISLQDEKQKEQKQEVKDPFSNANFVRGYESGYADTKREQKPVECLKAERDGWYVCTKDYYCGGKRQCSVGDLVQAKGGMYMMGEEDISEWFRRAYYEEVRNAFEPNDDTTIPEKPVEWSEEDENKLNHILEIVHIASGREASVDEKEELESFLKSLRPSWKPSKEQIYSLGTVVKGAGDVSEGSVDYHLKSLYEQLKRIKED